MGWRRNANDIRRAANKKTTKAVIATTILSKLVGYNGIAAGIGGLFGRMNYNHNIDIYLLLQSLRDQVRSTRDGLLDECCREYPNETCGPFLQLAHRLWMRDAQS